LSYEAIAWCRPLPIRSWPKAVLVCLATHHNERDGRCDPSIRTIALETGCNVKTARQSLRALEEMGAIQALSRAGHTDQIRLILTWKPLPVVGGVPLPDKTGVISRLPLPDTTATPPYCGRGPLPAVGPEYELEEPDASRAPLKGAAREELADAPSVSAHGPPNGAAHDVSRILEKLSAKMRVNLDDCS
jgi:hypothetical protein